MTGTVVAMHPGPDRPLPASEAAEQALLGALMVQNTALDEVAGFLAPEHFYFAGHGRIYETAMALHREGRQANVVTLAPALASDEEVTSIGGARYLADLMAGVVSVVNAPDYAQLILEMFARREMIAAGQEIAAGAFRSDLECDSTEQAEIAIKRITSIADASAAPTRGPQPISSAIDAVLSELCAVVEADGQVIGAPTGLSDLDRLLGGLQSPDLVILAGRPGMGKTALGLQIARTVAEQHGPVAFYSLEMSREQLVKRLIAAPTGIGADRQRSGPLSRPDMIALHEATNDLFRLPLLLDEGRDRRIAGIRGQARRVKRERGLSLIVIDYLQLLITGSDNRWGELSQITRDLKLLAKDVGVPVLALSQLSRALENRDDKRPMLSDLRESGSIEQDADSVVFLYRPDYYLRAPTKRGNERATTYMDRMTEHEAEAAQSRGKAEAIVAKNRHGPTGTVECRFDGRLTRFADAASADYSCADQEGLL